MTRERAQIEDRPCRTQRVGNDTWIYNTGRRRNGTRDDSSRGAWPTENDGYRRSAQDLATESEDVGTTAVVAHCHSPLKAVWVQICVPRLPIVCRCCASVTPCAIRQPAPCDDFLCEVCIFRGWEPSLPYVEETDLDESDISSVDDKFHDIDGANCILNSDDAAVPPRAKRFRGGLHGLHEAMPCQPLEGDMEGIDVEDGRENLAGDAGTSAPWTPKRDVPGGAGGEEAAQTPAKTRRFDHNKDQMTKLEKKLDLHEERMNHVEIDYKKVTDRLDSIEVPDDRSEQRVNDLEKQLEDSLKEVNKKLGDLAKKQAQVDTKAAAAAAAASSSSSAPASAARNADFTIIVNGFQRETPRGQLEKLFDRFVKPQIRGVLGDAEYKAPYLLPSCVHVRCRSASQQRDILAALRSQKIHFKSDGIDFHIYGTT